MSQYLKQLKINRYKLDRELVRQPQLYMEWALKAADAAKETAEAKHEYEVIKAEIEKKIRLRPHKYKLDDKPTEGAIKAALVTSSKVKDSYAKYVEAQYNERILNDAKTAFVQRRKMLENLTQLNIQLHFADVTIPKAAIDESARVAKRRIQRRLSK